MESSALTTLQQLHFDSIRSARHKTYPEHVPNTLPATIQSEGFPHTASAFAMHVIEDATQCRVLRGLRKSEDAADSLKDPVAGSIDFSHFPKTKTFY